MPISFNRIPANWKVPLYWVEVDSSKAGSRLQLWSGQSTREYVQVLFCEQFRWQCLWLAGR